MSEKCCGTCRWHRPDTDGVYDCTEWYCDNEYSDFYTDYTRYEEYCMDYEER